jgi:hypothetical protein
MKIDGGVVSNDTLKVYGSVTYGGTLTVTNLNGTPALNDAFTLFNASGYSGSFAVTNLPPLATGLAWNWNPANGTLSVVESVNTTPTNITTRVSGNVLTLSWPADHTGWRLQSQTNAPGTGLGTNWSDVPGATSVNSVNVTVDPANATVFYRMVYP